MKNKLLIAALAALTYTNVGLAEPRIAVSANEGQKAADVQIILMDEQDHQLNYSTLQIKINGELLSPERFDDVVAQVVQPSALAFNLENLLAIPGIYDIQIEIQNTAGETGYAEASFELSQASLRYKPMALSWSSIWKTASKMSIRGVANDIIKKYLESKGYRCPPGPWWLCARSAS